MHLTDYDLLRLDRNTRARLADEALRRLSERLLDDLQSRVTLRELFRELIGLPLSQSPTDPFLRQSADRVTPLEAAVLQAVEQSPLLHMDETSWQKDGQSLWFWVFQTVDAVVYRIGSRLMEMLVNVLAEDLTGRLMSHRNRVYRHDQIRLRCWLQVLHKARGLTEVTCQQHPPTWRADRRRQSNASRPSADAVRTVLPLRHWVVARKTSFGSCSEQESQALTRLASIIDSYQLPQSSAWGSSAGPSVPAATDCAWLPSNREGMNHYFFAPQPADAVTDTKHPSATGTRITQLIPETRSNLQ